MCAVGTVHFAATEVLRKGLYSKKADLFTFGTFMWELHAGKCGFEGMVPMAGFNEVIEGNTPGVREKCGDTYRELMEAWWFTNAQDRPPLWQVIDSLSGLVEDTDDMSSFM